MSVPSNSRIWLGVYSDALSAVRDAAMAHEDVMALDERVAKLEKTMAKGFFDQG